MSKGFTGNLFGIRDSFPVFLHESATAHGSRPTSFSWRHETDSEMTISRRMLSGNLHVTICWNIEAFPNIFACYIACKSRNPGHCHIMPFYRASLYLGSGIRFLEIEYPLAFFS